MRTWREGTVGKVRVLDATCLVHFQPASGVPGRGAKTERRRSAKRSAPCQNAISDEGVLDARGFIDGRTLPVGQCYLCAAITDKVLNQSLDARMARAPPPEHLVRT